MSGALLRVSMARSIAPGTDRMAVATSSAPFTQAIDLATDDHEPACWHFRLDGTDYLAESDGHQWSLTAGTPPARADVPITATTQALAGFIFGRTDAACPDGCRRARS